MFKFICILLLFMSCDFVNSVEEGEKKEVTRLEDAKSYEDTIHVLDFWNYTENGYRKLPCSMSSDYDGCINSRMNNIQDTIELNGRMTADLYNNKDRKYVIRFEPLSGIDSVYYGITMGRNSGYFHVFDSSLGIEYEWHFEDGYVDIKDTTAWLRDWYYKIIFYK